MKSDILDRVKSLSLSSASKSTREHIELSMRLFCLICHFRISYSLYLSQHYYRCLRYGLVDDRMLFVYLEMLPVLSGILLHICKQVENSLLKWQVGSIWLITVEGVSILINLPLGCWYMLYTCLRYVHDVYVTSRSSFRELLPTIISTIWFHNN